ncbi:UDP-N-acetylglucosamine 2-epimerase [Solibacillus sp. FSL W7-1324]|uniref:UDP-N-acetylglucosamine 2-epimerase n=1 Tax=Solibacillus sp. FSL W7-1324 TaxID=2921701 RepID=UPI0030F763DC
MKKVLTLTGIRSEYDLLFPILSELNKDSFFDLGIVVSGAHLTPLHNFSVKQIENDGFKIVERIENLLYTDSLSSKGKSSAILMQSLTQTLVRENPDYLIVLGDREESIIGALTASYMNIPVIHFAGGDHTNPVGGNVDEQVRHATTKLSHLHLTMKEEHSERVLRLGEEQWRIHTVGSAGIDKIRKVPKVPKNTFIINSEKENLKDYAVVIYHPLNSQMDVGGRELSLIFDGLIEQNLNVFVGYPNSDPGFEGILEVIQKYEQEEKIFTYKNLDRVAFVNLLRSAKVLVGNSSLGLHEAPYLCLPTINVGERQRGRLAGLNVQFIDADKEALSDALQKALYDEEYLEGIEEDRFLYGDGYTVEKVIKILKELPSKETLLAKKITY